MNRGKRKNKRNPRRGKGRDNKKSQKEKKERRKEEIKRKRERERIKEKKKGRTKYTRRSASNIFSKPIRFFPRPFWNAHATLCATPLSALLCLPPVSLSPAASNLLAASGNSRHKAIPCAPCVPRDYQATECRSVRPRVPPTRYRDTCFRPIRGKPRTVRLATVFRIEERERTLSARANCGFIAPVYKRGSGLFKSEGECGVFWCCWF